MIQSRNHAVPAPPRAQVTPPTAVTFAARDSASPVTRAARPVLPTAAAVVLRATVRALGARSVTRALAYRAAGLGPSELGA